MKNILVSFSLLYSTNVAKQTTCHLNNSSTLCTSSWYLFAVFIHFWMFLLDPDLVLCGTQAHIFSTHGYRSTPSEVEGIMHVRRPSVTAVLFGFACFLLIELIWSYHVRNSPLIPHDDSEIAPADEEVESTVHLELPPPVPEGDQILSRDLDISLRSLFSVLFSDNSKFLLNYHQKRGDKDLSVENWTVDPSNAAILRRTLTYRAPVKAAIGPPSTRVTETQCCSIYGDHMVLETTLTTHDLPYGDYFTVKTNYRATALDACRCRLTIDMHVNFTKKTFFATKINSNVLKESTKSSEIFLEMAQETIAKNALTAASEPAMILPPSVPKIALPTSSVPQHHSGANWKKLLRSTLRHVIPRFTWNVLLSIAYLVVLVLVLLMCFLLFRRVQFLEDQLFAQCTQPYNTTS